MRTLEELKVKIFADGADYDGIIEMSKNPMVSGFTTNPSLIAKAGETDYEAFAKRVLNLHIFKQNQPKLFGGFDIDKTDDSRTTL